MKSTIHPSATQKGKAVPDKFKAKMSTLNLIYSPISSRVASLASNDKQFAEKIAQSDFYMIGGRAKASFLDVKVDIERLLINVTISIAGGPTSKGSIDLSKITELDDDERDTVPLKFSKDTNYITLSIINHDGNEEIIKSYTPESMLMLVGRKNYDTLTGFDNFLEMSTFDLLYVGIAKKGDTFSRLIAHGHHARQKILSEEPQRFPGALVSDEIFIFPFTVDPLFITSFGVDSEIEDEDLDFTYDNKKIVADAEKAFVSLLKPPYNKQLFANYPKGADGLYSDGLRSYSYSIAEGLRFRTTYGDFTGARDRYIDFSNDADSIIVEGDEVTVYVAARKGGLIADGDD